MVLTIETSIIWNVFPNLFDHFFRTMIIGYLGTSSVMITLDAFSNEDSQVFTEHWNKWAASMNKDPHDKNDAAWHLYDLVSKNSLALNETSSTITMKWTSLFKENTNWKFFFDTSPFQVSVTKVSIVF